MKKEPKGLDEKKLDELKKSVEDLERSVAEWHRHNLEDVERKFKEWEREYKTRVGYDSAEPAIREFVDKLLQLHRETLLKKEGGARKKLPARRKPGKETIH
jgi:hypothetical protein